MKILALILVFVGINALTFAASGAPDSGQLERGLIAVTGILSLVVAWGIYKRNIMAWNSGFVLIGFISMSVLVEGLTFALGLPDTERLVLASGLVVGTIFVAVFWSVVWARRRQYFTGTEVVSIVKPNFFIGDLVVGQFANNSYPTHDGDVAYTQFRGLGHFRMLTALKDEAGVNCYFERNRERMDFRIVGRPSYGVLTITGLNSKKE